MKKTYPLRASLLILVLALAASPFARAQTSLQTGRTALAQQTPEAFETAHQAFKTGLQTMPNDAALNFFYATTLLTREAHTDSFKQQFTSLNATIINPSIYGLEYSFPLGFAGILQPPAGVGTEDHLAYLNSKSALIDEALTCLYEITDGNFTLTLTSAETSLLDTKVDFADICLLRAGLHLARASLHLANSYNLSGEYRTLYNLYAAGNLTPQAVLAAFPQLFNLSLTPDRRSLARAQIQLAHAEWNKALAAINTKRPNSEGSVLGPIGYSETTPFLFAFDSLAAAEEVDVLFDTLVTSLSSQVTFPAIATEDFALEGYKINLSTLVTSPSGLRYLAPTRFDRGFFRPSTWPDATLGGVFPEATQDNMNDAGNFLFLLQPTVYEPYQFWLLAGAPGDPGYFEDGEVRFNDINSIAVDANGNIYVADEGNHVIRKISQDNKVTTIAGQKWSDSSERQALQQQYEEYEGYSPYYPAILDWNIGPIAVDGNGTVYFVNGRFISKVTAGGKLSNLAGSLPWSYQDAKDGLGANAAFNDLQALATDKNGNIYACDANAIRKITPAGQVTTLAGKLGWDDSEGYVDGAGTAARFNNPTGVAVDDFGVVYVMDSGNFVIRKIQPNGATSTFVGDAKNGNYFDAKGAKARLSQPEGLAIDSSGNLYFTDGTTIRKVKPDGTVTTLAGKLSPEHGNFRISEQMGIREAAGEAAVFGEDEVTGLAVDRRGTLYAAFENSIYEAESIAGMPSGTPFPTPTPLPTPTPAPKPSPAPTPDPSPAPTPQLLSLNLSTTPVDLSNGPVEIPFWTTNSKYFSSLSFSFREENGPYAFGGYANGNSYRSYGKIKIGEYTKSGNYTIDWLDFDGRDQLSQEEMQNLLGPNFFLNVTGGKIDNTPSALQNFQILTTEVNADNSEQKVHFRIQVSDELSGPDWVSIVFSGPTYLFAYIELDSWGNENLVDVNGTSRTYQGFVSIPQGTPPGDWVVQQIGIRDIAQNHVNFINDSLPEFIKIQKFSVDAQFLNPPESPDLYSPLVNGVELNPAVVNVSTQDQKVKVRILVNNDNSTLGTTFDVNFSRFTTDGTPWNHLWSYDNYKLVDGTSGNGIYEAEIIVPKYSKTGNYTLSHIRVVSSDGKQFLRESDNIPEAIKSTLVVVSNTPDITAPVLQNISVSPTAADTRNGTVSVTANLTITDDLIGLQEDEWSRSGALALRSPSGKEFLYSEFTWGNRISGNSTNGTYQVQFELPQYSEEGDWTVDYIELIDRNYNTRFLIPANLTAQQIAASTIQVQGWPRTWETFSSNQQNTANQAKVVITKQSAKFWFPIANIDGNWTWGTGEGGYSFQGDYLEYDWSVEILRNPKHWLSFTHLKKPNETAQSGNFTEFLAAGQVNVWEDSADGGTIIESASISASRNGTCLLIELTDSAVLSKLQKAMPSYVPFLSFDPSSGSYNNQNVKVEYVKEDVQLSLGNLTHTADGTDKIPSVTSTPGNHTQDVTITYNGTTSPPSEPGTYTVVAFLNAANYKGRQVETMTISKPIQTIAAFSAISVKVFGAGPFAVAAPTSSSSLPVTLSVKSGPATISANNTVTLIGAGTVVLAANQAGNENYSAASEVTTSFSVSKSSQTIAAFGAISDKVFGAGPFAVTVPTSSSSLPVTLSVKSGPASVNGNTVTLTGAGTVVLAANQSGNANYNAAPEVTTSFSVTAPPVPAPPAPAPQAPAASNKGKKPAASKSNAGAAAKKPAASKSNAGAAAKKPAASKSNAGAAAKKPAAKKAKKK
jgi:hypothetical protein